LETGSNSAKTLIGRCIVLGCVVVVVVVVVVVDVLLLFTSTVASPQYPSIEPSACSLLTSQVMDG